MDEEKDKRQKTFTETITVAGNELVKRVQELVKEGNVRRLIIRNEKGDVLLEIPLTAGFVVGGAVAVFSPVLAVVGTLAGLLAKVKIEIVRTDDTEKEE